MNEKITDVLNILDKEDNPSQREIAKKTGFSLGLVNILIKKSAKKGLLKIEKLNSRNIQYILTTKGIKEKTKKTINYVKRSYKTIQKIQCKLIELAKKDNRQDKEIWILKEGYDEIFELVVNTLDKNKIKYRIINLEKGNVLENKGDKPVVLYHWHPGLNIKSKNVELVNIFEN